MVRRRVIAADEPHFSRRALLRRVGVAAGLVAFGSSAGRTLRTPNAVTPSASQGAHAATRVVGFIANSLSDTVTLVDGKTLEPFGTLRVGHEPHKFRRSLRGDSVYICNTTGNELIEIDLRTLRAGRHIPILDPYNIAFTADGRRLYKLAFRYTFVEVHDAHTFRRIKRIETGHQPSHFALSEDRGWFANANQHSDVVTVIDTRRLTVIHRLPVDPLPAGVAFSRDARYLFVASGGAGTINVFATDEWRLAKRVQSGKDAHEMTMTGDGRTIFVTNRGEDTVSAFDVAQQRVMTKLHAAGGPDMPTLSPDESRLWVSGRYGDTATVIDTRTLRVLNTFATGRSPHGVFVTRTPA